MGFDLKRLRHADRLMGGGAVALFIFMFFFKWFGASLTTTVTSGSSLNFSSSVNAWHSLHNTRWLLLLTIIAALAAVFEVADGREWQLPVSLSAIVTGLAAISAIFVFYRIIDHPHGGETLSGIASLKYGAKPGLYLGFIACLVIAYGGYLAMQAEGASDAVGAEPPANAAGAQSPASAPVPPASTSAPSSPAPQPPESSPAVSEESSPPPASGGESP